MSRPARSFAVPGLDGENKKRDSVSPFCAVEDPRPSDMESKEAGTHCFGLKPEEVESLKSCAKMCE